MKSTYFLIAFSNNSPLSSGTPNLSSTEEMASLITTTLGFFSPLPVFVAFFASTGTAPSFFCSVSPSFPCCVSFSSFFSSVFPSFLSDSCFFLSSSSSATVFSFAFSIFFSSDPAIMSKR
jgi:hypothetical protein